MLDTTRSFAGSIIVPAHNEAAVIDNLLAEVDLLQRQVDVDAVVVCNGCTDGTAGIVRKYRSIALIQLDESSKTAALNAGVDHCRNGPFLFVDADSRVSAASIKATLDGLAVPRVLAARPSATYTTDECSFLVRSYYRARLRITDRHRRLWGAGIYGLSDLARGRFDRFPSVVADDLWIDSLFSEDEVEIFHEPDPVLVAVPRNVQTLLKVLRRVYRGNRQIVQESGGPRLTQPLRSTSSVRVIRGMLGSGGVLGIFDAVVYCLLTIIGKIYARSCSRVAVWERDDTNRAG